MSIKRRFEDNSDVEEFYKDKALQERIKKYYEDHPQESEEKDRMLLASGVEESSKSTKARAKNAKSAISLSDQPATRSRTYIDKKISQCVNAEEVICDYCYSEKGITRTYPPSFLARHQAGKKCVNYKNSSSTIQKDCQVARTFFDECEDMSDLGEIHDIVEHFAESNESDIFKTYFLSNFDSNVTYSKASSVVDKLGDICDENDAEPQSLGDDKKALIQACANQYVQYQEHFYEATYGVKCLSAQSFQEMITIIRTEYYNKFDAVMIDNISIYLFWITNQLSRRGQQYHLDLHHELCERNGIESIVPRSTVGVSNQIKKCLNLYQYGTLQIQWPPGWQIDSYDGFAQLKKVELYLRDPMELISELFVNPEIMFKYRDQIYFEYFNNRSSLNASDIYSEVMCSLWCKNTEEIVRKKNPEGKIMPLIFYSDGVQLNDHIHNNVTPVMCTTGNFSDELIDKDISKCVIGYLPNLLNTKAALRDHLYKIFSKTEAELEIRRFDLLVEREYWKEIVKGLRKHWETGIQMHVLGKGIKTFFPCVAFFVGDDPQQHRQAGLECGNCIHGCIYCTYSYKDGLYNDKIHLPRDANDIIKRCCEAERSLYEHASGRVLSRSEESNLKYLKAQNIHPFVNPMSFAPMGDSNNNIFRATPPDLLHNFCAGLMKSLVKSIISIIYAVSKISDLYKDAGYIFDRRIINFEYVTQEMPHVHWTYFKEGIMRYLAIDASSRSHSTGSFGGYKSTSFISLLIQIHYAIGHDSKILPSSNFVVKKNQIEDIQGRVHRAICSVLDCYFDAKRSKWDEKSLLVFSKKIKNLYTHYMLVWDLNVALLSFDLDHTKVCKQRNPHKIFHLEDTIRYFGSLNHCDTSSWEGIHRSVTTGVYSVTSKRQKSLCLEMLLKCNLNNHSKHLDRIVKIRLKPRQILEDMQSDTLDDGIHFSPLDHHAQVPFTLHYSTRSLQLSTGWDHVTSYEPINTVQKFLGLMYDIDFASAVSHSCDIDWRNDEVMREYSTKFVGALKYCSDPNTSLGQGKLFATPRGNIHRARNELFQSKYDFALVKISVDSSADEESDRDSLSDGRSRRSKQGDDRITTTILLKLILFILIENKNSDNKVDHIFCLGQELYPMKSKKAEKKINKSTILGKQFCWAGHPLVKTKFKYHFIPVESIVRLVLVVPSFKDSSSYINRNKPKPDDTFYLIDRIFFDRTGWDEEVVQEEFFVKSTAEQIEFMARWSLGNIQVHGGSRGSGGAAENHNGDSIFEDDDNYDSR